MSNGSKRGGLQRVERPLDGRADDSIAVVDPAERQVLVDQRLRAPVLLR